MSQAKPGSMREQMPQTAAWIDELRQVFGADQIDPAIRRGMAGQPNQFHAIEGEFELGTTCAADPARLVRPVDWSLPKEGK